MLLLFKRDRCWTSLFISLYEMWGQRKWELFSEKILMLYALYSVEVAYYTAWIVCFLRFQLDSPCVGVMVCKTLLLE